MNVSAIIVTRGDVDLCPILFSLPAEWEKIIWAQGRRPPNMPAALPTRVVGNNDLSVYGRYAAIEHASNDLIYVQDDDVIVSDPQVLVETWSATTPEDSAALLMCHIDDVLAVGRGEHIVCNMPQEFRHEFYKDHALVGFGAVFHRDSPQRAFAAMGFDGHVSPFIEDDDWFDFRQPREAGEIYFPNADFVRRTCDIIVTGLSPRILVDVPKENLPHASDDNRMYRQPEHQGDRSKMLTYVKQVREEAS